MTTRAHYRGKPVVRMHAMVKPTGPVCNLACSYCYDLGKSGLLDTQSRWRMSDEMLERFIRQYIEGQNSRKAVALEKAYAPPHMRCENDLQTNGTLLDDDGCAFLEQGGAEP